MKCVRGLIAVAIAVGSSVLLFACGGVPAATPSRDELAGRVRELLERDAANSELRAMMRDDSRLWGGARFGAPQYLDVRITGDLATDVVQSANSVPTRSSLARELLSR